MDTMEYQNTTLTVNETVNYSSNITYDGTDYECSGCGVETVIPVVFSFVFIVGLIGNGSLIYIVCRYKSMRNIPNILITNLAVGDFLLIIICVPFTLTIYAFPNWPYGDTVCKVNEFLQTVSLGVSVFTLSALSIERYSTIVRPFHSRHRNALRRTLITIVTIWFTSIAIGIPDLFSYHTIQIDHQTEFCWPYPVTWPRWYGRAHVTVRFLLFYVLPLINITWCYIAIARALFWVTKHTDKAPKVDGEEHKGDIKTRQKIAKVILSLVVIFGICWLPRHIYLIWFFYALGHYSAFWQIFKSAGFALCFINSCLNPVMLYFLSKQFKYAYHRAFCCHCHCQRTALRGIESDTPLQFINKI
ncbi:neuropeptide CCHamide-1 receptor [Lingula anatina]|uniref:Neuropeptide CCHamide-1 receptor n=1 Tax=Lingula anatina TaxID=7574 RepID=A0A1S3JNC7_LINAN|nr:neuropeptide CCHamide-1 receptor [Lingula anatina]|eukprot:XP_013411464.1 neuropeptide CCHamide-1 receptor [Lingula anatina]